MNLIAASNEVIFYRSRGEQMRDEFWYDTVIPAMADHPVITLTVLVIFVALCIYALTRK